MTKFKAIFLRRWSVLALTMIIGALAGYFSAAASRAQATTVYTAGQVIVTNRDSVGTPVVVGQDALKMTRGDVAADAAKLLGVAPEDAPKLVKLIVATPRQDTGAIAVTSKDKDPAEASRRVDAFTKAFLKNLNAELSKEEHRRLVKFKAEADAAQAAVDQFQQTYPEAEYLGRGDNLAVQIQSKRSDLITVRNTTKKVASDWEFDTSGSAPYKTLGPEAPKVEDSLLPQIPDNPIFRAVFLALIGVLLGGGLVMVVERINQRIDTREELAEVLSVPIISEIGHLSKKRQTFHSDDRIRLDGVWAEHYRRIRSAIQFVQAQGEIEPGAAANGNGSNGDAPHPSGNHVFMFTSTLPGEGKSTSVALTALAMAEVGVDTLVINADFRKPRVDTLLGASKSPNLADRATLDLHRPSIDEVVQQTDIPHLWAAASGAPTYEVGSRLQAAREVAAEAASRGATVIIDSTPLRVANDTIDLLPVVDQVILVIRSGRTTVRSLVDTLELLELHSAPIMGAVLIGTQGSRELYAYYDSYYSRVQSSQEDERPTRLGGPAPEEPPPAPAPATVSGSAV